MARFRQGHLERIVDIYGRDRSPRVFVETGTYHGTTVAEICDRFDRIHTIELSEKWYQSALKRFKDNKNVICHQGDSAERLEQLMPELLTAAVFFLDAHYSGGETALGREEVPLMRELQVLSRRRHTDIIIIDDVHLIGKKGTTGKANGKIYPLMEFDWTNISLTSIRETLRQNRWLYWNEWDNRIIVITNQSLSGLVVSNAKSFWFSVEDWISSWKRRAGDAWVVCQQETLTDSARILFFRFTRRYRRSP